MQMFVVLLNSKHQQRNQERIVNLSDCWLLFLFFLNVHSHSVSVCVLAGCFVCLSNSACPQSDYGGRPAFVCGPPHCEELCSHVAGRCLPALSESQQASPGGESEQRDPVGVHLPLGSAHPQQLLLIQERVNLDREDERKWMEDKGKAKEFNH